MEKAVNLWTAMLAINMEASNAGKTVLAERVLQRDTSLGQVVIDCLGTKAASTALLRARSLKRYCEWCSGSGLEFVPISESNVHAYVTHLEHTGGAATS
eukprot:2797904-Amphidinium_carterae.1